jgi:hypothetical protein
VVARLRAFELADLWGFDRRAVLETFLHATRAGLLELQWDLLCPLCRGAKETADTLGDVQQSVHCEACNIDFRVNFDRSVELPAPAIRSVERHDYCVGGPRLTPHIAAQQLLGPGTRREIRLTVDPGRYRLRTLEGGEALGFVVTNALHGASAARRPVVESDHVPARRRATHAERHPQQIDAFRRARRPS